MNKQSLYSLMLMALISTSLMACAATEKSDAPKDAPAENQPAETREPASPAAPQPDALVVSIPAGTAENGAAALAEAPMEVKVGTAVTWTNNDTVPHTITSEDGLFDSGEIAPGQSFTHTFTEEGMFGYFCAIHGPGSLYGVIQVNP